MMAHYYFDLYEGDTVTVDPEGRDFASLDAARKAAVNDARAIMCEELGDGALCLSCHIDIMDDRREPLIRVLFKDAVAVDDV